MKLRWKERTTWFNLPSRYLQCWHMDNMVMWLLLHVVPVDNSFVGWQGMLWYAQLVLHLCSPLGLIAAVGGILIIRLGRGLYGGLLRYCLISVWIITVSEMQITRKTCNNGKFSFWIIREDPRKTSDKSLMCDQESLAAKIISQVHFKFIKSQYFKSCNYFTYTQ